MTELSRVIYIMTHSARRRINSPEPQYETWQNCGHGGVACGIGALDGAPQSEGVLHELASIEVRKVQRPIPKIVADDRPRIKAYVLGWL